MHLCARPLTACAILCLTTMALTGQARAAKEDTLKVGITRNFFLNFSETIAKLVMQPFPEVVKQQTGLPGEIAMSPDSSELCERMLKGDTDLGVFQGIEFHWACLKHPDLKPLMLAVNEKTPLKAYLIVRKEEAGKPVVALSGKSLAIPSQTRPFARLWMERRGVVPGKDLKSHYGRVIPVNDSEDALDDVIANRLDAVLVEKASWDRYKRLKPTTSENLAAMLESETFPSTVIAYFPDKVRPSYVDKFRKGMLTADKNPTSQRLLQLVKISSFEPVPQEFLDEGKSLLRDYPPASVK